MKTDSVPRARLVVLVSGNGTNLQAIIDACSRGQVRADIVAVISNKESAYGLARARAAQIPALVALKTNAQDRRTYDAKLATLVGSYQPDWVVLAGWMRVLSMPFLSHFPGRVVNLHPALPGTFPGTDAIERAFHAFQAHNIDHTGVMVHFVPDEGVDCGPVLATEIVPIYAQDTLADLEARVHTVEHRLLVTTIEQLIERTEEEIADE